MNGTRMCGEAAWVAVVPVATAAPVLGASSPEPAMRLAPIRAARTKARREVLTAWKVPDARARPPIRFSPSRAGGGALELRSLGDPRAEGAPLLLRHAGQVAERHGPGDHRPLHDPPGQVVDAARLLEH